MASYHCVVADYCTGANGRVIADFDVFADDRARPDGHVLADLGGGGNEGGGMNGAIAVGVAEQLRGSGESETRLTGDQQRLGRDSFFPGFSSNDGRSGERRGGEKGRT